MDNSHPSDLQEDRGRNTLQASQSMSNYLTMKSPGSKVSINIFAPPASGVVKGTH